MKGRAPRSAAGLALALVAAAIAAAHAAGTDREPLPSFQALVDATPDGGVLRPAHGRYAGPAVVSRPMTVDGGGGVTIDAGGRGTVLRLQASGAALRGLRLVGSGSNHDTVDAGLAVVGSGNVIEDNTIEDCLFGIDLSQSNHNVIRRNRVHSKARETALRGDAIRLWYSFDNQIVENDLVDVRDLVVWYSGGNWIARNRVVRGRYALHTMYAHENHVEDNEFIDNMTGVFLMYSDGVVVRRNRILGAQGSTGVGVGFEESSNVVLEDNDVVYCATGIMLDLSPYEPDAVNRFARNRVAYNGVGVTFHTDWTGNEFRDNEFRGNFTQVAVRGGGGAARNLWVGNYFDDYQGFDRDGDGRGDTPYELRAFADRIWMSLPPAAFFRASPLLEVVDFLDRLAPFSAPTLILRDEAPRFERSVEAHVGAPRVRGPS